MRATVATPIQKLNPRDKYDFVTGGTGSPGKALTCRIVDTWPDVRRRFNLSPATSARHGERFTIVYPGSLYERFQFIAPLVQALKRLVADGTVQPVEI